MPTNNQDVGRTPQGSGALQSCLSGFSFSDSTKKGIFYTRRIQAKEIYRTETLVFPACSYSAFVDGGSAFPATMDWLEESLTLTSALDMQEWSPIAI